MTKRTNEKITKEPKRIIGLFGDIHFQEKDLERIISTSKWIIEEFKKNEVTDVICTGDILNTREKVCVESQSAALTMFDSICENGMKLFIILGNHDMNQKHSTKITSLDALNMKIINKSSVRLFKDTEIIEISGQKFFMVPYHEDTTEIIEKIKIKENEGVELDSVIGIFHISIPGAIQRYQKRDNQEFIKKYEPPNDLPREITKNLTTTTSTIINNNNNGNVNILKELKKFKRVFSGHFHHHHTVIDNIMYVGSPMQQNFGDSGDDGRGVVIYYIEEGTTKFLRNPQWDTFRTIKIKNNEEISGGDFKEFKDKKVSVIYENYGISHENLKKKMIEIGVREIKKDIQIPQINLPQKKNSYKNVDIDGDSKMNGEKFENDLRGKNDIEWLEEYLKNKGIIDHVKFKGIEIIKKSSERIKNGDQTQKNIEKMNNERTNEIFNASITTLIIENFLGVKKIVTINFEKIGNGLWFIEGKNGSGKSTILEAITWCLFGELLRKDIKSDHVINDDVGKNCLVKVNFKNGYSIERFRKYGTLKNGVLIRFNGEIIEEKEKGSIRDSQKKIDTLLGINFDIFNKTIIIGDNSVSGTLGDSKKRRELIEYLLGVDRFDVYLEDTKNINKVLNKESLSLKTELDVENSNIISLKKVLLDEDNKKNNIDNLVKELVVKINLINISSLRLEYQKNEELVIINKQTFKNHNDTKKISSENEKLKILEERLEKLKNFRKNKMGTSTTDLENYVGNTKNQIEKKNEQCTSIKIKLNEINNEIKLVIEQKKNKICITCKRPLDLDSIESMKNKEINNEEFINSKKKEMEILVGECESLNFEVTKLRIEYEEISNNYQSEKFIEREISSIKENLKILVSNENFTDEIGNDLTNPQKFENWINSKKNEQKLIKIKINEYESGKREIDDNLIRLQQINETIIKFTEMIEKKNQRIIQISSKNEELQKEITIHNFYTKVFDRKSTGFEFETLRSFVVACSVVDLNLILTEYSTLLGSEENMITMDNEMNIIQDYGKRSAGQRRRNELSLMFALFELVKQRSNFNPDFLMLDEVMDALDIDGQDLVKNVLEITSQRIGRIYMITHSVLSDRYKNVLKVFFDDGGTHYPF